VEEHGQGRQLVRMAAHPRLTRLVLLPLGLAVAGGLAWLGGAMIPGVALTGVACVALSYALGDVAFATGLALSAGHQLRMSSGAGGSSEAQ
jgi:hypothetical protein